MALDIHAKSILNTRLKQVRYFYEIILVFLFPELNFTIYTKVCISLIMITINEPILSHETMTDPFNNFS